MARTRHSYEERGMRVNKRFSEKLFDGQTAFIIPYFQRAYVWDRQNWEPFLESLESISDDDKEHFMGFIVLKIGDSNSPPIEYSVIDGQQRLTTFFLFARALCEINDKNFDKIKFYSSDEKPILFHNHNDKKIFDMILEDGPLDKQIEKSYIARDNKILGCYNYFLTEQRDRLEKLDLDKTLKNLSFVCMYLTEDDDEQKIFDTMNSLGAPLGTGDLLKNELFSEKSNLSKDAEEFYEETWKKAFENDPDTKEYWDKEITAGRNRLTNLDMLLHSYLAIKTPDSSKSNTHGTLFKRYKDFLSNPENNKENFINDLMEYANIYREYIDPEDLRRKMDSESLTQRLNIIIFGFPVTTIIPYILYILKEVEEEDEKKKIFALLECYLIRRLIAGAPEKNYNKYFMAHIKNKINSSEAFEKAIYDRESDINSDNIMPDNSSLDNGFRNKDFSNAAALIILYFLEHYATAEEASATLLPIKSFSVEHLMPRRWEKHWSQSLPNPEAEGAKEERNKMILRLGNLTLITATLNSSISNAGWNNKKEGILPSGKANKKGGLITCCSGLATFSEYLEKDNWDENAILERGEKLLTLTKELWSYNLAE